MQNQATILVVENGDMLRPLLGTILRREGHIVMEAQDGHEALFMWDRCQGAIDLVVTDVVMPNMNGKELVDRLRSLKPDVKVIYMSGYKSSILTIGKTFNSNSIFLQKPFRPNELSQAVRDMLEF